MPHSCATTEATTFQHCPWVPLIRSIIFLKIIVLFVCSVTSMFYRAVESQYPHEIFTVHYLLHVVPIRPQKFVSKCIVLLQNVLASSAYARLSWLPIISLFNNGPSYNWTDVRGLNEYSVFESSWQLKKSDILSHCSCRWQPLSPFKLLTLHDF